MQNTQENESEVQESQQSLEMTKSKRKRLRKHAKSHMSLIRSVVLYGAEPATAAVKEEDEEVIVIKTKGFWRNEILDAREDLAKEARDSYQGLRDNDADLWWTQGNNRMTYSTSENVEGYVGNQDLDSILDYINGTDAGGQTGSKKQRSKKVQRSPGKREKENRNCKEESPREHKKNSARDKKVGHSNMDKENIKVQSCRDKLQAGQHGKVKGLIQNVI